MAWLVGFAVVLGLVVVIVVVLRRKPHANDAALERLVSTAVSDGDLTRETFDRLSFPDLLGWFKDREERLRANRQLLAVLLRSPDGSPKPVTVAQVLYDMDSETVVEGRILEARALAEDVVRAFGDKQMLVVQ